MSMASALSAAFFFITGALCSAVWISHRNLKTQSNILHALQHEARGIYKRIDELEELSTTLREQVPELVTNRPWIIGWIESQSYWLSKLVSTLENNSPEFHEYSLKQKARQKH